MVDVLDSGVRGAGRLSVGIFIELLDSGEVGFASEELIEVIDTELWLGSTVNGSAGESPLIGCRILEQLRSLIRGFCEATSMRPQSASSPLSLCS
jgi:hypothetical protein